MTAKEQCGDYEIYQDEEGWWVVEYPAENKIIGKFLKRDDALETVAKFMQDDSGRIEAESVC